MVGTAFLRFIFFVLFSLFFFIGCANNGECRGSDCSCGEGASCEFECNAPPCKVDCQGNNPSCVGACANGDCECGPGSSCDLSCASEPCHADCRDSSCRAECGNGDCTCSSGSECDFKCTSGPCHVMCEGNHESCNGQCANGSCTCGPNSVCHFECTDANCAFVCESGSSCLAHCPTGTPGNQGCDFTECADGVVLCPDGKTLACNAECPRTAEEESK
jgi:hypothetical protein